MKQLSLLIFLIGINCAWGQNRALLLGFDRSGLSIGNSSYHNGLRLNFFDRNVDQINGLNLALWSSAQKTNGVLLNVLGGETTNTNGFAMSGLMLGASKLNGFGMSGLALTGDTLNGLFISAYGITPWGHDQITVINGLTIGGFVGCNTKKLNGLSLSFLSNGADTLNGVSIGLINYSESLHGVQLGLVNYAGNNLYLKFFPFINFNFRRPLKNMN